MKSERNRCIALAGLYQAATLVDQIGRHGQCDAKTMGSSLYSLFQIDAESVEAVYDGLQGVEFGLRSLHQQLSNAVERHLEITQYAILLLQLEKKLSKQRDMLNTIQQGIEQTTQRLDHFALNHPNIVAQLADIYLNTISTLNPRIMVKGETMHLQNPDNANLIRALLLAGIRSAMLWRQCGGKKYQIIFGRQKLMGLTKELLASLPEDTTATKYH